jgi:membrane protein
VATIGTMVAAWAASRGFVAVVRGLDLAYDIDERRSYVRLRVVALALAVGTVSVVALMLGMLVVGPLLGTGQEVADQVGLGAAFATFWDLARWPVALAVVVAWSATVFHVGPNHRTPWRWDLPGAALTTVAWVALSLAFRLYLAAASGANQVLGALGGVLIVLLWLYLLAVGLLVGGELNGLLAQRHGVAQLSRGRARRFLGHRARRPPED